MNPNENKNQHFVPECYLKNFITNKDLYVLDVTKVKKGHLKKPRLAKPAGICYEEDYYKIIKELNNKQFQLDNYDDLYIEKEVLKTLEEKYQGLFKKIINEQNLDYNEAIEISDFILLMKLRNPYWFNNTIIKNKEKWIEDSIGSSFEESLDHPSFKNIPDEVKRIISKKIIEKNKTDSDFSKKLQLYSLIQRHEDINRNKVFRDEALNCEWLLFETPKYGPFFVTTDNPGFSITSFDNNVYNTRFKDSFVFHFPLSPRYCLVISDVTKDFSFLKREPKIIQKIKVDGLNILKINDSSIQIINKLIIASDDYYLNHILKNNKPNNNILNSVQTQ